MKKKTQLYAILGIAAVMFIVIVCVVPFRKGSIFVISLICELIAFALQIPFFKVAFEDRDSLRSKVLGFPVFRVGLIYLVVQTVLSLLLMILSTAIQSFPVWMAVVLCAIVLCGAVICGMTVDIARDKVENIEHTSAVDTTFMTNMKVRSVQLVNKVSDNDLRSELQKLADNIRFSDPVSNEGTKNADGMLDNMMLQLENAIQNDGGDISALCGRVQKTLDDRNTIAKMSKRR